MSDDDWMNPVAGPAWYQHQAAIVLLAGVAAVVILTLWAPPLVLNTQGDIVAVRVLTWGVIAAGVAFAIPLFVTWPQ